ncbi:MAG: hypothetical protein WCJ25_05030 [Candidatus Moraniibacteriota bacterium]
MKISALLEKFFPWLFIQKIPQGTQGRWTLTGHEYRGRFGKYELGVSGTIKNDTGKIYWFLSFKDNFPSYTPDIGLVNPIFSLSQIPDPDNHYDFSKNRYLKSISAEIEDALTKLPEHWRDEVLPTYLAYIRAIPNDSLYRE